MEFLANECDTDFHRHDERLLSIEPDFILLNEDRDFIVIHTGQMHLTGIATHQSLITGASTSGASGYDEASETQRT